MFKSVATLVGFAVVLCGLTAGWVSADRGSVERVGITVLQHMGDRS
jgi:hypothetical protein